MTGKEISNKALQGWHFDQRVPIALIVTMVGLFMSGAWYASDMNRRLIEVQKGVERNSEAIAELDVRLDRQTLIAEGLLSEIASTNRNLDRLQGEVSETNRLLRSWLERGNRVSE